MAVEEGSVRNSAGRAVVPGLCDTHQNDSEDRGFTVVRVAVQTFYHATWLVLATVHGDDFVAARQTQSLDMLDEALEQLFVLKKMPRIGLPEVRGTGDGQLTKRTVSWSVGAFAGRLTTHVVRRWCVLAFLTSGKRRGG